KGDEQEEPEPREEQPREEPEPREEQPREEPEPREEQPREEPEQAEQEQVDQVGPHAAVGLGSALSGGVGVAQGVGEVGGVLRQAVADVVAEDSERHRARLLEAQAAYVDVVGAHLRSMSAVPVQARTPDWRQQLVNTAAAFAANFVGFTVPTALAQFAGDKT